MAAVRTTRQHITAAAVIPRRVRIVPHRDRTVRRHVPTRHRTAPPLATTVEVAEAVITAVEAVAATTAVVEEAEATPAAVVEDTTKFDSDQLTSSPLQ